MKPNFDFERIWESKRVFRRRLAAAPIAEKLRMLDAMRARALTIRNATAERTSAREQAPTYKIGGKKEE